LMITGAGLLRLWSPPSACFMSALTAAGRGSLTETSGGGFPATRGSSDPSLAPEEERLTQAKDGDGEMRRRRSAGRSR
jgi:hypothetical protein